MPGVTDRALTAARFLGCVSVAHLLHDARLCRGGWNDWLHAVISVKGLLTGAIEG